MMMIRTKNSRWRTRLIALTKGYCTLFLLRKPKVCMFIRLNLLENKSTTKYYKPFTKQTNAVNAFLHRITTWNCRWILFFTLFFVLFFVSFFMLSLVSSLMASLMLSLMLLLMLFLSLIKVLMLT